MTSLLLTGFEPFGAFTSNPSWDALTLARDSGLLPPGSVLALIPVVYADAFDVFARAVTEHKPRVALSFGLHGGIKGRQAATFYVETTARNRDGASKADNAGVARPSRPIVAGAPDELPATLPVELMLESLVAAGFSAAASADAGSYLCNHLFFRGAHALQGEIPYGFVHVPPVDTQVGSLSLEQLARAVGVIARVAAGETAGS